MGISGVKKISVTQKTKKGTSTVEDKSYRYGTPIAEYDMGEGIRKTIFSDVTRRAGSAEEASQKAKQAAEDFYGRKATGGEAPLLQEQKIITPQEKETAKKEKKGIAGFIAGRLTKGITPEQSNLGKIATMGSNVARDVTLAAAAGTALYFGGAAVLRVAPNIARMTTAGRVFGTSGKQTELLANEIGGMDAFSIKNLLSKSYGFLKAHKKIVIGGGLAVAGGSSMMSWLASDNILTSANMMVAQTVNAVKWEGMSREEAAMNLDIAQSNADAAIKFINTNTKLNPLLIPFRKILMTNANATQQAIDLQKRILGLMK